MDPTLQPPEPEREPWATNDALEQSLRDSAGYVDRVLGGLDAATPDAEDLAQLLPEPVHYDPELLSQLTSCGIDVPDMQPEHVTTDLDAVTCQECKRLTSPLPPAEPEHERVEIGADGCGCPVTAEMTVINGQLVGDVEGTERVEHRPGCRMAAPAEPERRTVGLEVLTDDHRGYGTELRDGKVGIVLRLNDEIVLVPEVDTMWTATYRGPADILCVLLKQARLYADGGIDGESTGELLMPGPEVPAALAGVPVGSYTRSVPSSYGVVEPGWFVRVETVVDGRGDVVWLLVEDRRECDVWRDCPVAGGEPHVCHVVTVRGRGVQHIQSWMPVSVRIPAHTEVEL